MQLENMPLLSCKITNETEFSCKNRKKKLKILRSIFT